MAMTKSAEVIKRENIEMQGSFSLEPGGAVQAPHHTSSCKSEPAIGATCQVQIIESNTEYTVIEVTCACGSKSRIECRY